jgi:hypothetical protein
MKMIIKTEGWRVVLVSILLGCVLVLLGYIAGARFFVIDKIYYKGYVQGVADSDRQVEEILKVWDCCGKEEGGDNMD